MSAVPVHSPPSNLKDNGQGNAFELTPVESEACDSQTLRLIVRGAKCGGCLSKIEKAVTALPGVSTARLNLSTGQMRVSWQGALKADQISDTVASLGYEVTTDDRGEGDSESAKEERSLLIAMGVAGFAAANIMLLSVSVWAGYGEMGEATRRTLHALSGMIAFPVLLFSGRHFFKSAYNVLRHGRANMDVPISLALILAFVVSVIETIRGGEHAYFDAAVMLLFFLLIGRFLEARLKRQAYSAARSLAAMRNKPVSIVGPDGTITKMSADTVRSGDTVLLAPGERAMVDMVLASGESEIDDSLLTGESLPRLYRPGMTLRAGAINLTTSLEGAALGSGNDSTLSAMAEMLEAGEQRRSSYRKLADRAVSIYIPFVHTTAALAGAIWLVMGASLSEAAMISVTTLIITCPCALALAAPVTQVVAAGRLFNRGVYLRSGDALERIAEVDHVAFDKTGTLTLGSPVLKEIHIDDRPVSLTSPQASALIEQAATLARVSRHPLSEALSEVAGPGDLQASVSEIPGKGLEVVVDNVIWRLGRPEWVGGDNRSLNKGPTLSFRIGEGPTTTFMFEDQPLESAAATLEQLSRLGATTEIISGDRNASVGMLANQLGIIKWSGEYSPEDKVTHLENLRYQGKKTLMIGDGLNDTGALSLAHASLAPGSAMDVSQSASDAIYCGGLADIPEIIKVARRTRSVMRQNFSLAAGYNLIAVPVAVAGLVTPLVAAVAMSLSSVIVTLNALRLQIGGSQ